MTQYSILTVNGVDCPVEWDAARGAVATLPPVAISSREDNSFFTTEQLADALRNFDDVMTVAQIDLTSHGMEQVSPLDCRLTNHHDRDLTAWRNASHPLDFGSPVAAPQRSPEGVVWRLAFAGLPVDLGEEVSSRHSVSHVTQRLVDHLSVDADTAQVGIFLEQPQILGEARFAWQAKSFERRAATTVPKSAHIPYTRVKRLLRDAQVDTYRMKVYAFDVEDEAGDIVTPAIAITNRWGVTERDYIADVTVGDGLTEMETTLPNGVADHRFHAAPRVFVKQPELFTDDDAKMWLAYHRRDVSNYWAEQRYRTS